MASHAVGRFAALEIDSDEETRKQAQISEQKSNASKNAKKKARKKKKAAADSAATNELRNLAFSKPVSAKVIQNIHQQRHQVPVTTSTVSKPTPVQPPQKPIENADPSWEEWKNKDENFVVGQFQRDLEIALRMSETDIKQAQKNLAANNPKKKTKKLPTMSLEEFSLTTSGNNVNTAKGAVVDMQSTRNGYCPDELDPNHYTYETPLDESPNMIHNAASVPSTSQKKNKKKNKNKTDNKPLSDVLTELHDEKSNTSVAKVSTQPPGLDAASFASWQNDLEEKNKEIYTLHETVDKLKTELSEVKKRNEQLCFILAQGEMKDKADILLQVDEMTKVKNELSQELSDMYSSLEQERSKVTRLKDELTKYQGSRTKSKSLSEEK